MQSISTIVPEEVASISSEMTDNKFRISVKEIANSLKRHLKIFLFYTGMASMFWPLCQIFM